MFVLWLILLSVRRDRMAIDFDRALSVAQYKIFYLVSPQADFLLYFAKSGAAHRSVIFFDVASRKQPPL
jgi:hypothetical protein